jgi:hypothetical protein
MVLIFSLQLVLPGFKLASIFTLASLMGVRTGVCSIYKLLNNANSLVTLIYLSCYQWSQKSFLISEVNCTEPSLSVRIPRLSTPAIDI